MSPAVPATRPGRTANAGRPCGSDRAGRAAPAVGLFVKVPTACRTVAETGCARCTRVQTMGGLERFARRERPGLHRGRSAGEAA